MNGAYISRTENEVILPRETNSRLLQVRESAVNTHTDTASGRNTATRTYNKIRFLIVEATP